MAEHALIVGAGAGLSAALARRLAGDGCALSLAARDTAKLAPLAEALGATTHACDVGELQSVVGLFAALDAAGRTPDIVLFNPTARVRGRFVDLDPAAVERAVRITAMGGFFVAQAAVPRLLAKGGGTLLFTGASASVKGYPQSAAFAMGKFALRGLAQSLARELQPQNIHVAHVVIDGGIGPAGGTGPDDASLDPDAIAETMHHLIRQHRSAWTFEIELRPWVERF
jgi:NAD(P)-dependent dehydrogenase (short-subunit alcohol dehydrogenase family)